LRPQAEQRLAQARAVADDLLERQRDWPKIFADDDVWHAASRGECHVVLGKFDDAQRDYEYASRQPSCQAIHCRIMGGQLRLLLEAYRLLGEPVPAEMAKLANELDPPA
jgi:hypothetical protein